MASMTRNLFCLALFCFFLGGKVAKSEGGCEGTGG